MKMSGKFFKILLLIFFLADLFFVWNLQNEARFFTKTLLIPLVILIYLFKTRKFNNSSTLSVNKTFLLGLIFSFFGDVFLLFEWGFLPGLGSFLLAHIFYIICFSKISVKKHLSLLAFSLLVYVVSLLYFLFPYLNEMKIPVIFYAIVISAMLYFAVKTQRKFLILGALLFEVSDSLLAFNLFLKETKILSLLVMITYVFAQYLLVCGIIQKKVIFNETN